VRKVSYSPASPRGSRSRSVPSAIGVLRYSPDSRILAVGMQNAITILCDTKKGYAVKGYLGSHKAPVTHMDWSINGRHLRSVAADHRLCYFDINKEQLSKSKSNIYPRLFRNTSWKSQTCIFSYTTQGLHLDSEKKDDIATSPSFAETSGSRKSKGVLPAQILCVDVARKKAIIAAGDEEGYVHLVRSPCLEPSAQRKSANAHSVLVGQVRFADSESKILSVGAGDRTIIQWRLENTVEDTQYDGMVERKDRVFGAQQPQTFSLG